MSSKTEHQELSIGEARFQDFIRSVSWETIISIALLARRGISPQNPDISCKLDSKVSKGTFNAVWFIDFDDGVQWVFRTPLESAWSPIYQKRFQSDIWTMELIQSRTSVPLPQIITYSVSTENPFGRPYIILDRIKGVPLHKLWFDPTWFNDENRTTVLKSLASAMSQLRTLEFPKIGSIYYEDGNYVVGPLLPSYIRIINGKTDLRGPYNTVHTFLMDTLDHSDLTPRAKATLRILTGSLPDERLDGSPFSLSMPDYDAQNVFIDHNGNVTGLLDWDDVVVGPRQVGYDKFPLFLTRDIDQDVYGFDFGSALLHGIPFPPREVVKQDWPQMLPRYRAEFLNALKDVNPGSVAHCRHSHIVDPLICEVFDVMSFGLIEQNLYSYMFLDEDGTFYGLLGGHVFQDGFPRGEWIKQSH